MYFVRLFLSFRFGRLVYSLSFLTYFKHPSFVVATFFSSQIIAGRQGHLQHLLLLLLSLLFPLLF